MWLKCLVFILLLSLSVEAFKKGEKGRTKEVEQKRKQGIKKPEDIKIDILSRPANCKQRSKPGDLLSVHYSGFLADGTPFDSSRERGPFEFRLGVGQVIPGWEKGMQGMCVSEKRKLVVPPQYAYGEQGYPPVIPGILKIILPLTGIASATLTFEVELLEIKDFQPQPNYEEGLGDV